MRNLIFLLLGLYLLSCNNNRTSKQLISEIEYPKTNKKIIISSKIDSIEIINMTASNLRLLRNEIFARHGYIFKSRDLTDYFSKYEWYKPTINSDLIDKKLTEIDRRNISLIKSIENLQKCNLGFWNNELQKYIDLIPQIKLPLHFKCEEGFEKTEVDYNNDLIKKYKPEGADIIGKLYQSKNEVAIIYGYPADIFFPVIIIVNKKNEELRRISPFDEGNCVGDAGYSATTEGIITKNFIIKTKTEIVTWNPEKEDSERKTEKFENTIKIKE